MVSPLFEIRKLLFAQRSLQLDLGLGLAPIFIELISSVRYHHHTISCISHLLSLSCISWTPALSPPLTSQCSSLFLSKVEAIQRGLLKTVPQAVLDLLTWQELEKKVCGDPDISVEALQKSGG